MGNFNRDRRSGGRRNGGGRGSSRRDSEPKQMFHATCSDCGAGCEVPFRPSGDKPVYCDNCFRGNKGNNTTSQKRPSEYSLHEKRMFDAVCSECGQDCQLPFEPRNNKPVFCSRCFEKNGKNSGKNNTRTESIKIDSQLSNKLDALHAKMDKILQMLSSGNSSAKIEAKSEKVDAIKKLIKDKPQTKKTTAKTTKKKTAVVKKSTPKKSTAKKITKKKK